MRSQSLRILLIDDNRHGLIARRAVLEQLGHRVTTAAGGQEGIEKFEQEEFDAVVTDYRMPGVTGQQVIWKIRELKPRTPIILLSGFVEAMGLDEENTGADFVLSKGPREVQELTRIVTRLMRRPVRKTVGSTSGSRAGKSSRRAG